MGSRRTRTDAGIAVGVASLLALLTGHIRNNVHDFGLFVVGLALWTIVLGVSVFRSEENRDFV